MSSRFAKNADNDLRKFSVSIWETFVRNTAAILVILFRILEYNMGRNARQIEKKKT